MFAVLRGSGFAQNDCLDLNFSQIRGHLAAIHAVKADDAILQAYTIRTAVWGKDEHLEKFVSGLRYTPTKEIDYDSVDADLKAFGAWRNKE